MNLQSYEEMIRVVRQVIPPETSIALSDQSRYVMYQPSGAIDLKIGIGDPIKQGSIAKQTLLEGDKVAHFVAPDVYGVPYYGLGTPLYDDSNRLIGAMTLIVPAERSQLLPAANRTEYVVGEVNNRFIPVHESEIAYFSSEEGSTYMHTKTEKLKVRQTLQALEWMMPSHQFVRCHRSFLVNIGWIQEMQRNFHSTFLLIIKDREQTKIPVSQKYTSSFRAMLGF